MACGGSCGGVITQSPAHQLEITHDISAITSVAMLQPGTKTNCIARFSTVGGEKGSADSARDPRGFSVKCVWRLLECAAGSVPRAACRVQRAACSVQCA